MSDPSRTLFKKACRLIPGGVNSPVRAFGAVGGVPRFIARARGARVWDEGGRSYIDFVCSWGALILGHAHPAVVRAVRRQSARGTSYGAPTRLEVELAGEIHSAFPSMDWVRLVNSGTEAVMSAVRLARGATGRALIVKFDGCYHGHADALLVKAGSGAAASGRPSSAGVVSAVARHTVSLPFNDRAALARFFKRKGSRVAAAIVEPVAGNMGVILPDRAFLSDLRDATRRAGAQLIFDEVITGFRFRWGGVQTLFGIEPDLTTLGKIIGGGFPLAAFGGSRRLGRFLAPLGPVYQAGTLSGNPVATAAALATLARLKAPKFYDRLNAKADWFYQSLAAILARARTPVVLSAFGGMFSFWFGCDIPRNFAQARKSRRERFRRFFHEALSRGVFFAPSPLEANFISAAHSKMELRRSLDVVERALRVL